MAQIPCCCSCGAAGTYSSDSTPSLGTSICRGMALKRQKNKILEKCNVKKKKGSKSLMRHFLKKQLTFSNIFSYKQVIQGKGLKFMFTTSRFISKTNIFQSFPGDRLCFHPDLLLLVELSLLFKFHFLRRYLFSQTKPINLPSN